MKPARYSVTINAKGDPEKLFTCLKSEMKSYDRSSFTIQKKNEGIEFKINAKDANALRATLNTIAQLLKIYEDLENTK